MTFTCKICGVSSPRYCGVCGDDLRRKSEITSGADDVVEKQNAEFERDMTRFVGSDVHTRTHRLSAYLGGFSGAYSWTQCTPAGDFRAILAASPSQRDEKA